MRRLLRSLSICLALAPAGAWANLPPGLIAGPAAQCAAAIATAQSRHSTPAGLLSAIAQVESGRRDPLTGAVLPWPWTVDVDGEGHFYDTEAQAIAAVRQFQQQGRRSIDVGCMQINLLQHPDAFSSLEAAFDPFSNADYAATFLTSLHAGAADWMQAAGLYHSATPAIAAPYRARVAAALNGAVEPLLAPPSPAPLLAMAAPTAPFGAMGSVYRRTVAPPPPPAGAASGAGIMGRSLAAYRATPVWRR